MLSLIAPLHRDNGHQSACTESASEGAALGTQVLHVKFESFSTNVLPKVLPRVAETRSALLRTAACAFGTLKRRARPTRAFELGGRNGSEVSVSSARVRTHLAAWL